MNNNTEDFDFNISSIDEITKSIYDGILDTLLDEYGISHNPFNRTLDQINDSFLDTLQASKSKFYLVKNTKIVKQTLFDSKEEEIISNIAENLNSFDQSFNPFDVEPLPLTDRATFSKEQRVIVNVDQNSKSSSPKL